MSAEPIVVVVDRDLEDLVPIYLAQRHADMATFFAALPARDFQAIRRAAHGIVGSSASYGFKDLGALGQSIGEAARATDVATLKRLLQELEDYLTRLTIKYL